MSRIAIIIHRTDDFDGCSYVLRPMSDVWRAQGHEVCVVRGPEEVQDADLAILHVDLTVVPPEYLALAARYPKCLNRYTADISKRRISRHLLRASDDYDGAVIVKANLNSGGQQEAKKAASGNMPASMSAAFKDYAVFRSSKEVPDRVWSNPAVVVEKYLAEMEGELFSVRRWYFFGDQSYHQRSFSEEPVITGTNTLRREILSDVPDDLWRIREEMGFDFGKFDYTLANGRAIVFDANRTPTSLGVPSEMAAQRDECLASGLGALL